MTDNEVKVTFSEGQEVRVLRGILAKEDADYITLKRRDGIFKINKRNITCIEEPTGDY